jgi:uncharacterized protein
MLAKTLIKTTFLATGLVLLCHTVPSQAASFNCRYAKSPVEVAICQNDDLEILDERMASIYFTLKRLLPGDGRTQLKRGQNAFIARRNGCGYNDGCINRAYENRINRMCNLANDYDLDCDEFGD